MFYIITKFCPKSNSHIVTYIACVEAFSLLQGAHTIIHPSKPGEVHSNLDHSPFSVHSKQVSIQSFSMAISLIK